MPFDSAQGNRERSRGVRRAWHALAAYAVLSIVATWPLAAGLGRGIAGDLGDPVLNAWIIAWDCEQLLAILGGDFSRLGSFFDTNIFHPAPLTLAYSEHLIPQAVQVLPVYAISRNPVLAYNLVFLSTFILSGLGAYLLVRELTGNPRAAFVAGLLFAFAPYRFPQLPHVQVISSQWMPFALYGFRRFFDRLDAHQPRAWVPLSGGAASLVLQNLSCGYYLLYFSPFAAAYILWEMVRRDLWRRWTVWLSTGAAGVSVVAATVPFLLPYAAVRGDLGFARLKAEVIRYSADVYSYGTAASTFWSQYLRAFPKPEGDLFPGFVPLLLTAVGLVVAFRSVPRNPSEPRRWLTLLLGIAALLHLAAAVVVLLYRRVVVDLWITDLQISNGNQVLLRALVLAGVLLLVSQTARERGRLLARQHGFFVVGLVAAAWLSLGPVPQALGRPVEIAAPYGFLYDHVPVFEGVRAPARFAMIVVLMLSVLGGFGAVALSTRRFGAAALAVLSIAFMAEAVMLPFPVDAGRPVPGYGTPEPRLYRPARAPEVYKEIGRLPADVVVAELPLGVPDFDLRSTYYSLVHGRRVLNGYSGFFPPHYGLLALGLSDVTRQTDVAFDTLRTFGATHVVVHEGWFADERGTATTRALTARGATELYRDRGDVLLRLP